MARQRVLFVLVAAHVVARVFAVVRPGCATFGTGCSRLVEGRARRFLSMARRERVQATFVRIYFLAGKFRFPGRFSGVWIVRERPRRRDRGERAAQDEQSDDLAHSSSLSFEQAEACISRAETPLRRKPSRARRFGTAPPLRGSAGPSRPLPAAR